MISLTLTSRERRILKNFLVHTPWAKPRCRAQALLWLAEERAVEEVAALLHVTRQTVYNWVDRFRERRGNDPLTGLADVPHPGRPRTGDGILDPLIAEVIDHDPRELGYYSTSWTASLLACYAEEYHHLEVSRKTVSRAIQRLGIRWKRPRHQLALRPDTWRQAKGGSNAGSRGGSGPFA